MLIVCEILLFEISFFLKIIALWISRKNLKIKQAHF